MSHPVHAFPGQKELAHSGESVMLGWDQRLHMEERGLSILSAHPPCPFLFLKPTTHKGWFKNTHAFGVLGQFLLHVCVINNSFPCFCHER